MICRQMQTRTTDGADEVDGRTCDCNPGPTAAAATPIAGRGGPVLGEGGPVGCCREMAKRNISGRVELGSIARSVSSRP